MGQNSNIEWTDHTFNPWIGCTKVSPGCAHCYAETRDQRFAKGAHWGVGAPRQRTSVQNWKQPLRWERDIVEKFQDASEGTVFDPPLRRPCVFCASLADWLDDEVPIEWLADLLKLIHATPNLNWLLLTKRPENWKQRIGDAIDAHAASRSGCWTPSHANFRQWLIDWNLTNEGPSHPLIKPPDNVWVGTTVENQAMADLRIPQLLAIRARVRFLSCEPLLGPVDLAKVVTWRGGGNREEVHALRGLRSKWGISAHAEISPDHEPRVHWVICGGESGSGARPTHPHWARSLRDRCQASGVPFFFKQWGEWQPYMQGGAYTKGFKKADVLKNGDGPTGVPVYHVGKLAAGRLLDGREWNEFPKAEVAA